MALEKETEKRGVEPVRKLTTTENVARGRSYTVARSSTATTTSATLACAVVLSRGTLVGRKVDLVWKLRVVQLHLGLLGEAILGDSLKCLVNVNSLLGGRLKIGNVVLALAPTLGPLSGHLRDG